MIPSRNQLKRGFRVPILMVIDPSETGWIDEPRLLSVLQIPRSTLVGWEKAGLFARDAGGAYGLRELVALVHLKELRRTFSLEELAARWSRLTEQGYVADLINQALALKPEGSYELVVEVAHGGITLVRTDAELAAAVRRGVARAVVVLDLSEAVLDARETFGNWERTTERPSRRKPGRPARQSAPVRHLKSA